VSKKKQYRKLDRLATTRQRQAVRSWIARQDEKRKVELERKLEKERRLKLRESKPFSEIPDPNPTSPGMVNKILNGVAAAMGVVFRRRYRPIEAWNAIHVESGTTITARTKLRAWNELLAELQKNGIELKPVPAWEMEHGGRAITAREPEGSTARSLRRHKTVVGAAGYRRRRR
jgi:hypothetical protein